MSDEFNVIPLEYLEWVFIILFSFLSIYVLIVIRIIIFRLNKFLKNNKNIFPGNFKKNYIIGFINENNKDKNKLKIMLIHIFKAVLKSIKKVNRFIHTDFIEKPLLTIKKLIYYIKNLLNKTWIKMKLYGGKLYKLILKKYKSSIKILKNFIDKKRNLD